MPRLATFVAFAAAASLTGALAAEPRDEPAKQERICRPAAKQLGSRIRTQRRCRTAEQWQEEEKSGLPLGAQVTQGQNDGQVVTQPR
jgi:hypothetical protein